METLAAPQPKTVPLEAGSPFEMRVHLGEEVGEADVRSALKTGELGFLHSFTTGSAVDGGVHTHIVSSAEQTRSEPVLH